MLKRPPVKQKLLDILKKESSLTIQDMTPYFSISEIAVRRHLHDLEQQGFVQKQTIKQELGRPYHTYELTSSGHKTFPNQYETLPLELLRDLEDLEGKETVKKLLTKRMDREKSDFKNRVNDTDFDHKIYDVAEIQNNKGYMVEVSKIDEGHYELKHYNCPIANIAAAYKQVCSGEQVMYEDLFAESDVKPHSCITSGDSYCKWTIKRR